MFSYTIEYLLFDINTYLFNTLTDFKYFKDSEILVVVENTNSVVNILQECSKYYIDNNVELEEVQFHSYDTFYGKVPFHSIELNIIYYPSSSVLRQLNSSIFKAIIDKLTELISKELKITISSSVAKYIRLDPK